MAIFSSLQAATNITLILKHSFTVEENNSLKAETVAILKTDAALNGLVDTFGKDIQNIATKAALKTKAETSGAAIFKHAYQRIQSNDVDDRPLYWARNKMHYLLKTLMNNKPELSDVSILNAFERKSRGYDDINFGSLPSGTKKILITGYDPFYLNETKLTIKQSNPSGASALFLHNKTITNGTKSAKIQVAIMPVRYLDFDNGTVDNFFNKYFIGTNKVDMVITISQGWPDRYDVERFAGKYREANQLIDNLNKRGGTPTFYYPSTPGALNLTKSGSVGLAEFIETELPFDKMVPGSLVPEKNKLNLLNYFNEAYVSGNAKRDLTLIHSTTPATKTPNIVPTSYSIEGSGGNYLSNEIFYRVALLRTKHNSSIKTGHLHIPDVLELSKYELNKTETLNVLYYTQNMVKDAVSGL